MAQRNADVSLQNAMRLGEVYQALAAGDPAARADDTAPVSPELRTAIANQAEHFDMLGLQLGFTYAAGALAGDSDAPAAAPSSVREYVPSALPGSRLPHAWVLRDGRRVSTLDLIAYDRFTLITGPAGQAWTTAAAGNLPINQLTIGRDVIDDDGTWTTLLGIDPDGAMLVRPDQHVAWRSPHGVADPAAALARASDRILDRAPLAA